MTHWLRERSLPFRVLMYMVAALLAFMLAAGVGVIGALILRGELNLPGREEPQSFDGQNNATQPQQNDATNQKDVARKEEAAPQQNEAAPQQNEAGYVQKVGDIQTGAVETFLDTHDKLVLYDALTADDIEQMQANEVTLQGLANQADELDPTQEYGEHHEVFSSAINELHEATQLAYTLAADPTAATQSGFDEYDRHVNEASALLQRSNELLGQDYKTIEGVQRVNPLS